MGRPCDSECRTAVAATITYHIEAQVAKSPMDRFVTANGEIVLLVVEKAIGIASSLRARQGDILSVHRH
ncbi:MAG TPA: hypothetical protein VLV86_03485 [Vicinamibacterales bacterium]|nr:hypothetical protein [Vicinamibacterales bacterium]